MVTTCKGKAGFTLIQLMLSFCEHWRVPTELSVAINEMTYVKAVVLHRRCH